MTHQFWHDSPPQPRPQRRWLWATASAVVVGTLGLFLGGVIGMEAGHGRTTQVPQACLDAITAAEEGFGHSADALRAAEDAIVAIMGYDADGIDAATYDLDRATAGMQRVQPSWVAARDECRASAGEGAL